MIDNNILNKITDLIPYPNLKILEIGPGDGRLTDNILRTNPKYLKLIEIDEDLVKNLKLQTCVINLSRPGETYFHHTHADNTKVILYYPNINWNREWGGETLFYSSTSKELIFANEYVPNTLLYFDGSIPHTIRAPTYTAPEYRFTISTFWN